MTDATAAKRGKSRAAAAKESLERVVDKAADTVNDARHWADDQTEASKAWAAEQGQAVRDFVRERPVASVGISAGAAFLGGLLIGFLVGRAID